MPGDEDFNAWRTVDVVLDKNELVKTVTTNLDNDTAIHRIHKINPGKTTRDEALHILGKPYSFNMSGGHARIRYAKRHWREWEIELVFNEKDVVDSVNVHRGPYTDTCERGSPGACP